MQQRRIPQFVGRTERVQLSWFHGGIGRKIKKTRFYHEAKSNPTPENERQLCLQRRVVRKIVRQAKIAEEHRVALACYENPREFFGYVNIPRDGQNHHKLMILNSKSNHLNKGDLKSKSKSF